MSIKRNFTLPTKQRVNTALVLGLLLVLPPVSAQSSGPQISLFPEAVTAELAITRETAREMENGMVDIVNKMKRQKDLFVQSKCDGNASGSTGCAEMSAQLSRSYVAMLSKMSESLPEMKKSIQNTEKMLQRRIATELGRKKTPDQLQKALLEEDTGSSKPYTGPTTSGRSMSAMFERQFKLISQTRGQSVMSLASEIYLDMRAASNWIERLEAQIIRQKQMAELQTTAGIPPEMDATISEVTTLILGESSDTGLIDAPPSPGGSPGGAGGGGTFTM